MHSAPLHGSYDFGLVALSIALATVVAYASLDLAGRVTAAERRARVLWLAGGASAMGVGIWAMHYVGVLALTLPVPILYHYPLVILSLLAAIAASAVALWTVSRESLKFQSILVASVVMGGDIAFMHFISMAAMRMPAVVEYRWAIVALAIAAGIGNCFLGMRFAFRVRQDQASLGKLLTALSLGTAIPLTHYTAMWAVRFYATDVPFSRRFTVHVSSLGILAITLTTLLILSLAILSAFIDRCRAARAALVQAAQEGDARFHTLAEAIPQIVWIADANGDTTYISKNWYEMTGMSANIGMGSQWMDMVHPDDRDPLVEKWQQCVHSGETFEIEYRLHDAQKGYRWYLDRAVPLRSSAGAIQQWFGTCTDIEGQKHYQQILEQQIKERTEELADINTRLQHEMWEKDFARRKLDEQNEAMVSDLTARSQRATLLAQMGELLQSCATREEVFAAALGFAPKIFPARRGAIALFNSGHDLIEVAGHWNDCVLSMTVFEPEACWALRTGHPHLVAAGDTTACCSHAKGVTTTYLCVPILAQGEALGVLHIQNIDETTTLGPAEMSLKTTFASQVGLSVANIRLREALRSESIRDPLTGLFNRRHLEEMLERETRRAVRALHSLGVIMLDLDHFKKFNDTHGHDAGDTILRETSTLLAKSVRAEDIVCRFGGEEFVVILPMADLKATRARAERIRSKLRELLVMHQGRPLGTITASIGVASLPDHGTSPKLLIEKADAALYCAKNQGRDRVVVADSAPPEASAPGPVRTALHEKTPI